MRYVWAFLMTYIKEALQKVNQYNCKHMVFICIHTVGLLLYFTHYKTSFRQFRKTEYDLLGVTDTVLFTIPDEHTHIMYKDQEEVTYYFT